MNLKRGVLLSVAALMVGSVGVLACTRERVEAAHDESAAVDEACRDDDEAPGAGGDDAPATVTAAHRGDHDGAEGEGPGWFPEGPGEGSGARGQGPGWEDRGGPEGPRGDRVEGRGRGGRGRGQPGETRGRRGHRRGRRGAGGRGQRPQGGQGGERRFGGMEREVRPWLRALWEEIRVLTQGARGGDQGPTGV